MATCPRIRRTNSGLFACLAGALGCVLVMAATGQAQPDCADGQPQFMLSTLPMSFLLTPDHQSLVVLDQAFLAVRDPQTLKLRRVLAPGINQWSSIELSADRRRLIALTAEGMRFSFRLSDWSIERLADSRDEIPGRINLDYERLHRAPGLLFAQNAQERWKAVSEEAKLPPALGGGYITALGGSKETLLTGADKGTVRVIKAATKSVVAQTQTPSGGTLTFLEAQGDRILAGDTTGELLVYSGDLKLEQRAQVLPKRTVQLSPMEENSLYAEYLNRAPKLLPSLLAKAAAAPDPRTFWSVLYVPERQQLIWLATDFELGVYDLRRGQNLATLPATGHLGLSAFWTPDGNILLHRQSRLELWDPVAQELKQVRSGSYMDAVPLAQGRVLAVRADGRAEVLRLPALSVERTLCLTTRPCRGAPPSAAELARLAKDPRDSEEKDEKTAERINGLLFRYASFLINLTLSPDRRYVLVEEQQPVGGLMDLLAPVQRAIWDARSLTRVATLNEDKKECHKTGARRDWSFRQDGGLVGCRELFAPPRFKGMPEVDLSDHKSVLNTVRAKAGWSVEIKRVGDDSDRAVDAVRLLGDHGAVLGELAGGPALSADGTYTRGELRFQSLVELSPREDRILLFSRDYGESIAGGMIPGGALEVLCAPGKASPARPAAVSSQPVEEVDGIREIELPELPSYYLAIDGFKDTVYVLAQDEPADDRAEFGDAGPEDNAQNAAQQSLWRLTVGSGATPKPKIEKLALPSPAHAWKYLYVAPNGQDVWLTTEDRATVAHRGAAGTWSGYQTPGVHWGLHLLAGQKAVVAGHASCAGSTGQQAPTEEDLRRYYQARLLNFTTPTGTKSFAEVRASIAEDLNRLKDPCGVFMVLGPGPQIQKEPIRYYSVQEPDFILLPDGFLSTGAALVRYKNGRFLYDDPLFPIVSTTGAHSRSTYADDRNLHIKRKDELLSVQLSTGKTVHTEPLPLPLRQRPEMSLSAYFAPSKTERDQVALKRPSWAEQNQSAERAVAIMQTTDTWLLWSHHTLLRYAGAHGSAYFHPRSRARRLLSVRREALQM